MLRKMAVLGVAYLLLASTVAFAAPMNKDDNGDEATVTLVNVAPLQFLPAPLGDRDPRDGLNE